MLSPDSHHGARVPRKKKPWSKSFQDCGISVRIYERAAGAGLNREVRHGDGTKDRKALGHTDRDRAEDQARALLQRLIELKFAGQSSALTLGQLEILYVQHRGVILSKARLRAVKGMLPLMLAHFGRDFAVADLSQHHVDTYEAARLSGKIKSPRHRVKGAGVRRGTIRNELHLLGAMLTWAQSFRVDGRRLLGVNPLAGVSVPLEKNMRRPIATEARYQALLNVAAQADPRGRFRPLLVLVRHTGRRINAICQLKVSDVLRTKEQMLAGLAGAGMDTKFADLWPHGAIRWSEDHDKLGFGSITPISRVVREEIDRYLREHPRVGDGPLFSATEEPSRHAHKELARYWLTRAEEMAKQPKMDRGGFHAYRRLFASERRHLPAQDVANAGGWRSIKVMRDSYQQADAATVYSVVENASAGHIADTPPNQVAESQ
jgi:integrase